MESATTDAVVEKPVTQVAMKSRSVLGMQAPGVIHSRPIRDQVSDAEWQTRMDLAAAYRLMVRYGMTDMIYNHITARVPDKPQEFLINAYVDLNQVLAKYS